MAKDNQGKIMHRVPLVLMAALFFFCSYFLFYISNLGKYVEKVEGDEQGKSYLFTNLYEKDLKSMDSLIISYHKANSANLKTKEYCPDPYRPERTNLRFRIISNEEEPKVIASNWSGQKEGVRFIIDNPARVISDGNEEYYVHTECAVLNESIVNDVYKRAMSVMDFFGKWGDLLQVAYSACFVLSMAFVILTMISAAQLAGASQKKKNIMALIPTDSFFVSVIPLAAALISILIYFNDFDTIRETGDAFIRTIFTEYVDNPGAFYKFAYAPMCVMLLFLIVLLLAMSVVYNLRRGGLQSLCTYTRFKRTPFSQSFFRTYFFLQMLKVASVCVYVITESNLVQLAQKNLAPHFQGGMRGNVWMLLLLVFLLVEKAVTWPMLSRCVREMCRQMEKTAEYAQGDLSNPMDETQFYKTFANHARDLHSITGRIAVSADEYIRSNQFKAELITNLSHDIKTPLTAIISYAQLLQNPALSPVDKMHYLEVLKRHSGRLDKLVEDLTDVSDAVSGNVKVSLEPINLCGLVPQAVQGFDERLSAKGIRVRYSMPKQPVVVVADTRLLWRVIDNLMNNICKYAKDQTTVQVGIVESDQVVAIVFRNVSAYHLESTGEELMQRFVRGDSSRHTEGSGLGLSIARSLMQLQNGRIVLNTEGDVFTSQILFRPMQNGEG